MTPEILFLFHLFESTIVSGSNHLDLTVENQFFFESEYIEKVSPIENCFMSLERMNNSETRKNPINQQVHYIIWKYYEEWVQSQDYNRELKEMTN